MSGYKYGFYNEFLSRVSKFILISVYRQKLYNCMQYRYLVPCFFVLFFFLSWLRKLGQL